MFVREVVLMYCTTNAYERTRRRRRGRGRTNERRGLNSDLSVDTEEEDDDSIRFVSFRFDSFRFVSFPDILLTEEDDDDDDDESLLYCIRGARYLFSAMELRLLTHSKYSTTTTTKQIDR